MSQLNVDTIKNRLGTGGPTLSALTVTAGAIVGGALTVTGNFTVNGTQTIVNTQVLDIADKTVGIASTAVASNATADGAGIVVYGGSGGDKSITWNNTSGNWIVVGGGISATSYEGVDSTLDTWLYG
jgi:hypothetical protein